MVEVTTNYNIKNLTTLKIGGCAEFFCIVRNKSELSEAVDFALQNHHTYHILGGGSNLLINDDQLRGLTIKIEIKGKKIIQSILEHEVLVKVGAGEGWDGFVSWALQEGYYGLENLSAIPGTVGAAPIQNIGAYGVEVGQFIDSVEIFSPSSKKFSTINAKDCGFEYRNSIFKHEPCNRYIVTAVTFKLSLKPLPNDGYKDIQAWLKNNVPNLTSGVVTPQLIRRAVTEIRSNKLPDLERTGTAGSFFKNPIINQGHFDRLKAQYPGLQGFPCGPTMVKVSLGWILDHVCNVKGLCVGDACVYDKQALVLVNNGSATSAQIRELADILTHRVFEATQIKIEPEVVFW